jgi:hypothetical protein
MSRRIPAFSPKRELALPSVLLALALAGCGGGDGAPGATPRAGAEAADPGAPSSLPAAVVATAAPDTASQSPDVAAQKARSKPGVLVYVSPQGRDAWSGALAAPNADGTDGPLRTLPRAQAVVRGLVADMAAGQRARKAVRVQILPGTYTLSAPLALDDRDSGVAGYAVSWEGTDPGNVLVSGGVALQLDSTTPTQAHFVVPAGTPPIDWAQAQQLYVNGRRAILARTPDEGTDWFVNQAVPLAGESGSQVGTAAFTTSSPALAAINRLSADDRVRGVVNVYESWTTGRHRLAQAAVPGTVQVAPAALWPFRAYGPAQRWYIENVSTALDAPGEWLGSTSGGVTYLARKGESTAGLSAVVPLLDNLVNIAQNAVTGRPAQYIEFHGLRFEHTRLQTPAAGLLDSQAGTHLDAAINVDTATHVVVDDCRFAHLGAYAVWFRVDARDSTASNNAVTDVAGGFKIGPVVAPQNDPAPTTGILLSGNTVTDTGHVMPGAAAIWVGQAWGNTVTRNLVANTTYTGISVGWTWGFGPATSGNNEISDNLLFNIGQGVLSDLGGIYTVGISPGTVVRGNVVREVRGYTAYGSGAWGLYDDYGSSQITLDANVVVGTDSGGYLLREGHGDAVTDNVLAWGTNSEFGVSVSDPQNTRLQASGNLFVPASVDPFANYASAPDVIFSANTVAGTENGYSPPDINLAKCGDGCAHTVASLKATSAPKGLTLTGGTAATQSTFTETLANAGPKNWQALAGGKLAVATQPPVIRQAPPPWPYAYDLASAAPGSQPPGLNYFPTGNLTALHVVEKAGAPDAGKCLQFADSASYANQYDPHAYAKLNHYAGTSIATFTVWIDAQAQFVHEWRDTATPYLAGPSLLLSAKGVTVAGQVVAPLQVNAWSTIRVTALTGPGAGTWSLEVIDADGTKHTASGLPNKSAGWQALEWLGFMSNANVTTNACLGGLSVTNSLS